MVLIFSLILVALCGYYYYKAPEEFPENIRSTIGEVKGKTGEMVEKGRKIAGEIKDKTEKMMEKGKEVIER
jgi:hypothetical protein